jgi:hypothetical protein
MSKPSLYDLICEFNYWFGVKKDSNIDDSSRTFLSAVKMIQSEIDELEKALFENDKPEILDALGDIIYLVIGLGVRTGAKLEPTIPETEWIDVCEVALKIDISEKAKEWREVTQCWNDVASNSEKIHRKLWLASFQQILNEACQCLSDRGAVYYQIVDYIHQCNMKKFAKSQEHAEESVEFYRSWVSPTGESYSTPSYRPGPDGTWIIYDQEKNKVLKAKGWQAPDLSKFVRF